jgi:putative membrane protein
MRGRIKVVAAALAVAAAPCAAWVARAQQPPPPPRPVAPGAGPAARPPGAQAKGPVNDRLFVAAAAAGGQAEVAAGRMAVERAGSPEVKQFAQQVVDDHNRANQELTALASAKQIPLPAALDVKDQAAADRLGGLSGPDFDRDYIRQQVAAHMDAVAEFEAEAERGQDPDLKAFAGKTLRTMRRHLQMARQMMRAESPQDGQPAGRVGR